MAVRKIQIGNGTFEVLHHPATEETASDDTGPLAAIRVELENPNDTIRFVALDGATRAQLREASQMFAAAAEGEEA